MQIIKSAVQINTPGSLFTINTAVVGLADGSFVVAWMSTNEPTTSDRILKFSVFKPNGDLLVGPSDANTLTLQSHFTRIHIDKIGNDKFAIVWRAEPNYANPEEHYDVYLRVFYNNGTAYMNVERKLDTVGHDKIYNPVVAGLNNGSLVVVWPAAVEVGSPKIVQLVYQIFRPDGSEVCPRTAIPSTTFDDFSNLFMRVNYPYAYKIDVIQLANGNIIVARDDPHDTFRKIWLHAITPDGSFLAPYEVDSLVGEAKGAPALVILSGNQFVVTWGNQTFTDWGSSIVKNLLKKFEADGATISSLGSPVDYNQLGNSNSKCANHIAILKSGDVIVVWELAPIGGSDNYLLVETCRKGSDFTQTCEPISCASCPFPDTPCVLGSCQCNTNADCQSIIPGGVCDVYSGACRGCNHDLDCRGDVRCVNDKCGCSSDGDCYGATPICLNPGVFGSCGCNSDEDCTRVPDKGKYSGNKCINECPCSKDGMPCLSGKCGCTEDLDCKKSYPDRPICHKPTGTCGCNYNSDCPQGQCANNRCVIECTGNGVCLNGTAFDLYCFKGRCGCLSDDECKAQNPLTPICLSDGRCACRNDHDCLKSPGNHTCNVESGKCNTECSINQDCPFGFLKCYNQKCGCDSSEECELEGRSMYCNLKTHKCQSLISIAYIVEERLWERWLNLPISPELQTLAFFVILVCMLKVTIEIIKYVPKAIVSYCRGQNNKNIKATIVSPSGNMIEEVNYQQSIQKGAMKRASKKRQALSKSNKSYVLAIPQVLNQSAQPIVNTPVLPQVASNYAVFTPFQDEDD